MNPLFFLTHKKKLTAGSVLLASVLLFGFDGTWDRLSVALDQARGKADEVMPTDTLLSLARKQLTAAEQRLLEAEAATTGSQGQESRLRRDITRLENAATEARRRMETLRPALASTAGFSHCGSQYSQSEVRQDALLSAYPEWQRAARESGDLAVPQGQRFPQFSRASHVIPTTPIPVTWRVRRAALDFGGRAPHALWLADDPVTGQIVVYRERAPRRPPPETVITNDEFAAMCLAAEKGDTVIGRVGDSKSHGNEEGLHAFRRAGLHVEQAEKGPGSRVEAYNLLERYLRVREADGTEHKPAIVIMDCCPVLIDEIEQLRWEPERAATQADKRDTHPEDPDHGCDALGYELRRRTKPARPTSIFDLRAR
jgi:hypothetical protein